MVLYQYQAHVVRVIDGDTADLLIDLGFKLWFGRSARLSGINAPELNSPDATVRTLAQKSRDALKTLIERTDVTITSHALDKYGRPLVAIINKDGTDVNKWMIMQGYAVKYV